MSTLDWNLRAVIWFHFTISSLVLYYQLSCSYKNHWMKAWPVRRICDQSLHMIQPKPYFSLSCFFLCNWLHFDPTNFQALQTKNFNYIMRLWVTLGENQIAMFSWESSLTLFCSCFNPAEGSCGRRKLKSHVVRTQSSNVLPLEPGVGQYIAIQATLTARDFFLANVYLSGPSTCIFSKTPPGFFLY